MTGSFRDLLSTCLRAPGPVQFTTEFILKFFRFKNKGGPNGQLKDQETWHASRGWLRSRVGLSGTMSFCARPAARWQLGGVHPRVRRQEPSPSDSRGLSVPDLTRSQPAGSLLGGNHTLRIRGAGAWKMAEALGVNVFLTSGT